MPLGQISGYNQCRIGVRKTLPDKSNVRVYREGRHKVGSRNEPIGQIVNRRQPRTGRVDLVNLVCISSRLAWKKQNFTLSGTKFGQMIQYNTHLYKKL
jgi:hypothetical protein